MYCPPKLPLFIKKCLPNLPNLLYILICIVPLNYPFSLKNVRPPNLHNLLYILICIVPLNYHFSLKNVPLNFTICYIYLYVLSP